MDCQTAQVIVPVLSRAVDVCAVRDTAADGGAEDGTQHQGCRPPRRHLARGLLRFRAEPGQCQWHMLRKACEFIASGRSESTLP